MWVRVKSKETVCRERAKQATLDKYGHVVEDQMRHGRSLREKGLRLSTETALKYQRARESIAQYEEEMYLYFLETYEDADDILSNDMDSDSFSRYKKSLRLKDKDDIVNSEDAKNKLYSISSKDVGFKDAISILNKAIG